jgi:hypothetical protein
LALLQTIAEELAKTVVNFNKRLSGETDKDKVLGLLVEQNDILAEMAHRHRRFIDHTAGRKVKPEVQFVQGVLRGVGAGSMQ